MKERVNESRTVPNTNNRYIAYSDGRIYDCKLEKFREVVWGEFFLFKRKALEDAGGFNEIYKNFSAEDLEINFQLFSKDYEIFIDPRVFIYHEGHATIKKIDKQEINPFSAAQEILKSNN